MQPPQHPDRKHSSGYAIDKSIIQREISVGAEKYVTINQRSSGAMYSRDLLALVDLSTKQKAIDSLISIRGRFLTPEDILGVYEVDFEEAKLIAATANELLMKVQQMLLSEI